MGQPKTHLPWGNETMLQHVVRQLQRAVRTIVVVTAEGQQLPILPDHLIMARDRQPDQGPLEGISVGLQALPAECECAYVTSCDAPGLQPAFVRELHQRRRQFEVVVPRDGRFHHPLAAIYHRCVAGRIDALLQAGQRRPVFLFQQAATLEIDVEQLRDADPDLSTLQNVNTPEDYERLQRG